MVVVMQPELLVALLWAVALLMILASDGDPIGKRKVNRNIKSTDGSSEYLETSRVDHTSSMSHILISNPMRYLRKLRRLERKEKIHG